MTILFDVFGNFILIIQILFLTKCLSGPHIRENYLILMRKNNMLKYNYLIIIKKTVVIIWGCILNDSFSIFIYKCRQNKTLEK